MAKANKAAEVKPEVIPATDAISEAIENIKISAPHVTHAYFDKAGNYHFHKRPGFTKVAICGEVAEPAEDETIIPPVPPAPPVAPVKPNNLEF